MRPGSWQFVHRQRRCADGRRKGERHGRPDCRAAQATIGGNVLQGFVGLVQRDRSVIVMMVGFALPVKNGVPDFLRIRERRRLPGHGKGLPKGREQQKNNREAPTHANSLPEAPARLRMPVLLIGLPTPLPCSVHPCTLKATVQQKAESRLRPLRKHRRCESRRHRKTRSGACPAIFNGTRA